MLDSGRLSLVSDTEDGLRDCRRNCVGEKDDEVWICRGEVTVGVEVDVEERGEVEVGFGFNCCAVSAIRGAIQIANVNTESVASIVFDAA